MLQQLPRPLYVPLSSPRLAVVVQNSEKHVAAHPPSSSRFTQKAGVGGVGGGGGGERVGVLTILRYLV
jgi:hypothetical protein